MEKYLFNKIQLNGEGVTFIPFRKSSILESFLASTHSTFNQEEWEFNPVNFKDFLKMLSKTKLNDNGEYDITVPLPGREEEVSFETLLKSFASKMCNKKKISREVVSEFYTKAYQIKKDAKEDKDFLDAQPSMVINNRRK